MAQLQIHSWSISSFQWAKCWNLSVEGAVGTLQWFQHYCVFASWSLGVACIPTHLVMLCSSQESRAGSPSAITQHCSGPSNHLPTALLQRPCMPQALNPQWYPIPFARLLTKLSFLVPRVLFPSSLVTVGHRWPTQPGKLPASPGGYVHTLSSLGEQPLSKCVLPCVLFFSSREPSRVLFTSL